MMRSTLGLAALLALAGCASAPVHYHTLLAPPGAAAGAAPSATAAAPFLIELLPVGIPAQVDQVQLVVHEGDGNLAVLDNERWAGPLPDEIRGALSAALARDLGTQDIAGLPRPGGRPLLRIKVQVRRFDAWPGRQVQLDADWSIGLADDTGNARLACHGSVQQAAGGGYPELVRAQQAALAALAGKIAADARNWGGARNPGCA